MKNEVTVIRIDITGKTKPHWAIKYPSGIMHGQYKDKAGFTRFAAWTRKRDAVGFLNKMIKDAGELLAEMKQEPSA